MLGCGAVLREREQGPAINAHALVRRARVPTPDLRVELGSTNGAKILVDPNASQATGAGFAARGEGFMRACLRGVDSELACVEEGIGVLLSLLVPVFAIESGVVDGVVNDALEVFA